MTLFQGREYMSDNITVLKAASIILQDLIGRPEFHEID